MAAAKICTSGALTVAFPLSPIHLLTAFDNEWWSHKYRNGFSISDHEAIVKTLPIQADLSWSPPPLVNLCTAAFSFFFSSSYIMLFCLICPLSLLGPETPHDSLRACLSLCPYSNHGLFLAIALDIRLLFLKLWLLSSKHFFPRPPHVKVNPTRGILSAHCAFYATMLSSAPTALCLLSCPSSLLLWHLLACYSLTRFLFHRLQTGVVLRLFSSCAKPPYPSTCPFFNDHYSCSDSNELSNTTTVGPSSGPHNFRSSRAADETKEGLTLLLRLRVSWLEP